MVAWVTTPVAGSNRAVTVWPVPPNESGLYEDQVSSLPLGMTAAAAGTSGKPTGALHSPCGAVAPDRWPSTEISAALDHGPRLPASDVAVSRTYRAGVGANVTVCAVVASGNVPDATGA